MDLKLYKQKRDFSQSPEPSGEEPIPTSGTLRFVIQKHRASHLHFDLRLEMDGVYRSWAVPKGPSLDPGDRRLAVAVEEHPLAYGEFEGIIPAGHYGAGVVMIWDRGDYHSPGASGKEESLEAMRKGLSKGHLRFVLEGTRVRGAFDLVYLKDKKNWLLLKKRDDYSSYKEDPLAGYVTSVVTGRSFDEIAVEAPARGDVWLSTSLQANTSELEEKRNAPSWGKPGPTEPTSQPRASTQPVKVEAMRPVMLRKVLNGHGWVYAPQLGGVRALVWKRAQTVHLYSVRGLTLDSTYRELLTLPKKKDGSFVLDGEIVGSSFAATDVLYADGCGLRPLPYLERRARLAGLVGTAEPHLFCQPDYPGLGELVQQHPTVNDIIAKDPLSPYESKTSANWLRFKREVSSEIIVRVTHPEKLYWPQEKISKGDLVAYYESMADLILPHLKDRPLSLNRHPNGIQSEGFYHKDLNEYHPAWLQTYPIYSKSSGKTINYALCQNKESLIYLVNLGCIELNPWFSTVHDLDRPSFLAIDLDPDAHSFAEVVGLASRVKGLLDELGLPACVKTSGATGLHIAVPLRPVHTFDEVVAFAENLCKVVEKRYPDLGTTERSPGRRKRKIYLDYLQNRRSQTLAAVYCVRPRPGAPVSTPLAWSELAAGEGLRPEAFHIGNTLQRLATVGPGLWDLSAGVELETFWPDLRALVG